MSPKKSSNDKELQTIEKLTDKAITQDAMERAFKELQEGNSSVASVPLMEGDKVVGVLNVYTHRDVNNNIGAIGQGSAIHSDVNPDISLLLTTGNDSEKLTPKFLSTKLAPFLNALDEIQKVIISVLRKNTDEIRIRLITQNSPISVSLDGAAEAVQAVQNTVIPWRRKHTETMARLLEQEKITEIEIKKAEILEKRAIATKSRVEADKLTSDIAKQREEIEKMKLENERLRLDLNRNKVQLALEVLDKLSPQLSEAERIAYVVKLLPPLDVIVSSNLEVLNK